MDATIVQNLNQSSFKLSKMSKGYNWEIKKYGDNLKVVMEEVKQANEDAKKLYDVE